jgi:predicted anti-sigma-YlaC factor YlaD
MRRVEKHVARCQKCRDLDEELGWSAAMRSPFMAKVRKLIEERKKAMKGRTEAASQERLEARLPRP